MASKQSAAEVVKNLTKESINNAGKHKGDVSVEDFQRINQKSVKRLKIGIRLLTLYFIAMLVAAAVIGLNVKGSSEKKGSFEADDVKMISELEQLKTVAEGVRKNIEDFNSGDRIEAMIQNEMMKQIEYAKYIKLMEEINPLHEATWEIINGIENSGGDTILPESKDFKTGFKLQAYYSQYQGAFFDHGCHIANCNFTGQTNRFTTSESITDCLKKCHAIMSPLRTSSAVKEFGLTFDYKESKRCYCKTTGAHSFHKNSSFVYYRFA